MSGDYRCKGDRFTRGLAPVPLVHAVGSRADGSRRTRRLRTSEAGELSARQLLELVPRDRRAAVLARTGVRVNPIARTAVLEVGGKTGGPGELVRLTSTPQKLGGERYWLECPRCFRRRSKLFTVHGERDGRPWGYVACRVCLGLAYPSQARAGTASRDWAIWRGEVRCGPGERMRAHERMVRRMERLSIQLGRLYG